MCVCSPVPSVSPRGRLCYRYIDTGHYCRGCSCFESLLHVLSTSKADEARAVLPNEAFRRGSQKTTPAQPQ